MTGQAVDVDHAVLEYRTTDDPDAWCRECGAEGIPRGTAVRRHTVNTAILAIGQQLLVDDPEAPWVSFRG